MSETTTTAQSVVDGYFAMWNEPDPGRRKEVIAATWAPEATYVDPIFAADGHEGLDGMVAAAQQQFPGHRFRLTGAVDAHHDRARWAWDLVAPDGMTAVAAGVDFAVLDEAGRLWQVTGFLEPAPAATT